MEVGNKWTLRSAASPGKPVVIEVLERNGNQFLVRFSSPFGASEWMLQPIGNKYYMTKFGVDGKFMDLPAGSLYFDFDAQPGQSWSNSIGKMSFISKEGGVLFIRQQNDESSITYGFTAGRGFTQFGEGRDAFLLEESATRIIQGSPSPSGGPAAVSVPVPHVPTPGGIPPTASTVEPDIPRGAATGKVLFSMTPNAFANQSEAPENLLKNFQLVVDSGMGFIIHNAKWNEFEPRPGQYNLDPLRFNVDAAKRQNIPIAYTFRLIETVARAMPADLTGLRWTDKKIEDRLMKAIGEIVRQSDHRIRWFMLGNEIDGYFGRNPKEIQDFAQLFTRIKVRLKELEPKIQVSSTLMFGGVGTLDGFLRPLNDQYDFLSFTYYPIRGDFTMQDPDVVRSDVDRMRSAARGRKIVLQEVGYSTGARNRSNQEKQAQFVQNVFTELRGNSDMVEAACFFVMADLKDQFVGDLSGFYGIKNSAVFDSFLQTLGFFDANGQPKKSWEVYTREVRR